VECDARRFTRVLGARCSNMNEVYPVAQAARERTKAQCRPHAEGPLFQIRRAIKKLHSLWLAWTYPFISVGKRFSVHPSCDLRRSIAGYIRFGDDVLLDRNVRVEVVVVPKHNEPVILIDDNCNLGQRTTVLALNKIHIERNNLFGPSVFVTDHNHEFQDVTIPIISQGTTRGGTVRIEEGCWFGFGAAVVCSRGELVIGRNSVIGAYAVVTRSVPAYSMVTGNPARVVKQFDLAQQRWVKVPSAADRLGTKS
jgi:acetyltransferase-like isoleucine patch superfamily enzyme